MRLHALVEDAETARRGGRGRRDGRPAAAQGRAHGRARRARPRLAGLGATFVVNDDVDAALELGCGVHLGQNDAGAERALAAGLLLGHLGAHAAEAAVAEYAGADYLGAGPIWATPSKPDAGEPIGLDGLREICLVGHRPGRRDRRHRRDERRRVHPRGAAGVAVIRAVAEIRELREAVDAAL